MKKISFIMLVLSLLIGASCTKKGTDSNEKVLNLVLIAKVKGLDPIYADDRYSSREVARVYEGLLEYHYLKRPFTLVPNLAESMPTVSKDGLTYTFKLKKGVKFHDSEAFTGGKGREMVAEDFVYSIKRLADPKTQGLGWWVIDNKIKGLNEWREASGKADKTNYDAKVEGLQALDKYTLQFKLTRPFPQFLYSLVMPFTYVIPKEGVAKYGKEFLNHPIGTGPFKMEKFNQTNRFTYIKNPEYREKKFPCEGAEEYKKKGHLDSCGKTLPLVDKIVVNVNVESQPRWLGFMKGKYDFIEIPKDNFDAALPDTKQIGGDLKEKGIVLNIKPQLDITYTSFNHDLKLFQNKKLKQAMSVAYNVNRSNELFYNNRAIPAQSPVPPGIAGFVKGYESPYRGYGRPEDVKKAKELLVEAGYPNGEGLPEITYDCAASTVSRQIGEYFAKQMAEIGIKIKVRTNPWPELQKKINNRTIMLHGIAWGADYPDAENFLQLLYGPNRPPGANGAGYDNPEFNQLYESAAVMQDTPERTALYEKMARMISEEVPWVFGVHRQAFFLEQGWLKNYVSTDFEWGRSAYLDVDMTKKKELIKKF